MLGKKGLSLIVVAMFVGIVGVTWGYHSYQKAEYAQKVSKYVKGSTIYLTRAIDNFEKQTDITLLAPVIETDVAVMEKNIVEVESLSEPSKQETTDKVVQYLKAALQMRRMIALFEVRTIGLVESLKAQALFAATLTPVPGSRSHTREEMLAKAKKVAKFLRESEEARQDLARARQFLEASAKKLVETREVAVQIVPLHTVVDSSLVREFEKKVAID